MLKLDMFGSVKSSCLASRNSIPCIHNLKQQMLGVTVKKWTRTKAYTGRNRLDTHFSHVSVKLKSCVMNGHGATTEKDTRDAISYHGGIAGTTAVLLDGGALESPVLRYNKEFKASKTRVRETHTMVLTNPTPQVHTMPSLTIPQLVKQKKMSNY